MKKVFERIIEGMLTCSGFVTSITILLIVLFLFTEAFGLFKSKVIEEGYVLALNKSNKVSVLSPAQIKNVFDEEITNWKELGGEDLPIRVFRLEDITQYYTEEELEAYRRAEAMERNALVRAQRLKEKLSQLCQSAHTRYTDSGEELEALSQDLSSVLSRMQDTIADLQVAFDETEEAFEDIQTLSYESVQPC